MFILLFVLHVYYQVSRNYARFHVFTFEPPVDLLGCGVLSMSHGSTLPHIIRAILVKPRIFGPYKIF